jgi:hypothetical protein
MNTGSRSVLVSQCSKVLVTVPRFPIAVTRSGIANEGRRKIMCNAFILRGSQQSRTVIQAHTISTLVYFMHATTDTSGFATSLEYSRTIM